MFQLIQLIEIDSYFKDRRDNSPLGDMYQDLGQLENYLEYKVNQVLQGKEFYESDAVLEASMFQEDKSVVG